MTGKEKSFYNVCFGLLGQAITICLGIIIPRLILVSYGSEINGLLNSLTQIFTYVNLLEAGVGMATIQALYEPLANHNQGHTNSILAATSQYYKKAGILYLFAVLALAFIYPMLINNEIDFWLVFWVIIFTGMGGVINFLFQGKIKLLLEADGRNYIISNVTTIIYVMTSFSKVFLLRQGFNVIAVQASVFIFNLVQMLFFTLYTRKRYGWLDFHVKPKFDAIDQKNSVLIHQISGLIFNNADIIILSVMMGLKVVSVYSMYTLIISMVMNLINQVNGGFKFKLGQTFNTNREQYYKFHNMYEVANMILVFTCFTIVYIFILPFMTLYTAGADLNYIDKKLPLLFIMVQLLSNGRVSSSNLINYAGHFKLTQRRAILESSIKLLISIICVYYFGIYGTLIGTIAALLYRSNDMVLYCYHHIIHKSPWVTYRRWIVNFILFSIITIGASLIPAAFDSYFKIIFGAGWYFIMVLGIFVFIHSFFEKQVYLDFYEYFKYYIDSLKTKLLK